MSDLPNHDHDPDPAALDELQRAFADPDSESESELVADLESDPEHDRATDVVAAVEPTVESAPPAPEIVTLAELRSDADRDRDADRDADRDDRDSSGAGTPADLLIVEQASSTDTADSEDRSRAAPGGAGAPRVIRIDDLAGSTEVVDDATPEALADAPGVVPADAGPGAGDAADGVISISDDDLPDAVYVQGSLDADGSGTIVFIEDDDTGDVLGPESERDLRRGIEPRLRERRVAVKRAQGRKRLVRVAIGAGVVLVVVAVLAVLGSPLFSVREGDVEVFGARYTDEDRLAEIVDEAVGTPVLRLDTDQIEADIEAIPWVDDASVSTDFPHGLIIDIREREAVTTYRGPDGRFRVLDRDGRVLDVLDLYPFAYVVVVGPDPVDLEAGEFAPQGYVAASELAKNLTGSMRGRVTEIEVTADGSRLAVHLDDGSTVLFGEARDLLAKLVRLEAVLTNGEEREPGVIDVSTADVTR